MKKIFLSIALVIILVVGMFTLTGCTFKVETSDNSVTASVDGETTEKVDGIIDWIVDRLSRIFKPSDDSETATNTGERV